ncbi:MAG: biopolymer transporter ExbD [Spirochaetaceae bacterium]|jgi:biopolymer transport protein ExbD|nr:biopolymer transporter ExbD [Spirochaetaceae bacterium]
MNIRRKKRQASEAMSALSDLAFILIIYFIVIAAFNINKGFLMNLPAKDSTRLILKEDILRFELNDRGALIYMEKELNILQAEKTIALAAARRPNLAMLLSISPQAPWQSVVSFVKLAEKLKVDSFSFKMMKDET